MSIIVSSGKKRKQKHVVQEEPKGEGSGSLQPEDIDPNEPLITFNGEKIRFKKPNPIESSLVLRMSTTSSIRNVRASRDWGEMAMRRHYRDNRNEPQVTQTVLSEEEVTERASRLAKGDALDAYGARTTRLPRTHFEAITVYR